MVQHWNIKFKATWNLVRWCNDRLRPCGVISYTRRQTPVHHEPARPAYRPALHCNGFIHMYNTTRDVDAIISDLSYLHRPSTEQKAGCWQELMWVSRCLQSPSNLLNGRENWCALSSASSSNSGCDAVIAVMLTGIFLQCFVYFFYLSLISRFLILCKWLIKKPKTLLVLLRWVCFTFRQ